ncbi:hypothetical protein GTV15_18975 [Streptomyces sp. SID7803]|nr:hypothetical protein [Streptomyces sp. SID7803]
MTSILIDRRLPHSESARDEADAVVTDLVDVPGVLDKLSTEQRTWPINQN